ncbi:MAG: hypothetical protein ACKVRO_06780 [Micropepsaceae bacterium]
MAVKQKVVANRAKAGRKKANKTMNQFATAARRKTKTLGRDAETAVANASEWADDQASTARAAMRPQPVLTAMLAAAMAWQALGLRAGAKVTKRWLAVSGLAFYHPLGWWTDAEKI